METKYFSKGGQYPYQVEGEIDDKFFYYRARHDNVSLTLYPKIKENMVYKDTYELQEIGYSEIEKNSFVTDEEAEEDIKTLYKMIENNGNKTT